MGVKMEIEYQGEKACEVLHVSSGSYIDTDAPKDNGGKGEAFSPTDLMGVALGTCILTTMDILAEKAGKRIPLEGAKAEVVKEMTGAPRMIASLNLKITLSDEIAAEDRKFLEEIALTCPVARSLHPDVKVITQFVYQAED